MKAEDFENEETDRMEMAMLDKVTSSCFYLRTKGVPEKAVRYAIIESCKEMVNHYFQECDDKYMEAWRKVMKLRKEGKTLAEVDEEMNKNG